MSKKDIISKIINQANSLNKKVKKFKEKGVEDHLDFITSLFNNKQMQYKKDDKGNIISLSKAGKTFYSKQNELQLKRTLSILTKINNHDVYGTVKKYEKTVNDKWVTLTHTIEEYLSDKGYPIDQIKLITTSNNFINTLSVALNNIEKGFGSEQIIEKTFLNYQQYTMNEVDVKKAISDLEYGASKTRQIDDMSERFKRFLEMEKDERGKR
ncbi:hypothetical protein [Romboutsia sp.]|uniref:hypothetical protein n=1 Tax=Romboutsia sp. TaxID=1965302 RepID=UPI003F3A8B5A